MQLCRRHHRIFACGRWRAHLARCAVARWLARDTRLDRPPGFDSSLGGRFATPAPSAVERLREFVARESFRAREWRVAGGAVPLPPRPPALGRGDEV